MTTRKHTAKPKTKEDAGLPPAPDLDSPTSPLEALGLSPAMLGQLASQYLTPVIESSIQHATPAIVAEASQQAASQAAQLAAQTILSQLPALVQKVVAQQVDQVVAGYLKQFGAQIPQLNGGGAPEQMAAAQPPMGGGIGPLIQQFLASQIAKDASGQSGNPFEAVAKALEGLAGLFGAVDKIRGAGGPAMTPNSALAWQKWGYDLAKAGAPPPDFPLQGQHVPPSRDMGEGR